MVIGCVLAVTLAGELTLARRKLANLDYSTSDIRATRKLNHRLIVGLITSLCGRRKAFYFAALMEDVL